MKAVRRKKRSLRDEVILTQQSLNDRKTILELENRCLKTEKDYNDLKEKLVGLLLPEQIAAAHFCGVTPEFYALEWIDIFYKDKIKQYAPAYAGFGTRT